MTEKTPDDAVLVKVRKLLAKAEDEACTPAEAELFTAKAAELIARYGIDAAMLAEADPSTDRVGDRVIVTDAPYALDKAHLLYAVASALGSQTVRRTRYLNGRKQLSMHLFGFGADLERVELLYTSLLIQAAHALVDVWVPYGESVAAYRRTWYAGYADAIGRRLRDAERRAQDDADDRRPETGRSVALVLADRSVQVKSAVASAYPRLTAGRSRRLSGQGYRGGFAAGQRANLGGNGLTHNTNAGQIRA